MEDKYSWEGIRLGGSATKPPSTTYFGRMKKLVYAT
jgi:hypothetical protein